MLNFYYKDVLHLAPKPSIADRVHIVFELAQDIVDYDLAQALRSTLERMPRQRADLCERNRSCYQPGKSQRAENPLHSKDTVQRPDDRKN